MTGPGVLELLVTLALPFIPIALVWLALRHGPLRNPLWRGENPFGFALFVGAIAFLAGFVGPIVLAPDANQGPLLGIFITGPAGLIVGFAWGLLRALRRRADEPRDP